MSDLVTGDAVVLGLRPARLPSRALAICLDVLVYGAGYLLVSIGIVFATASLDDAAQAAVSVGMFLLVLVGVPIAVETLTHGRSLGKLALGLRVVRDDGGPIRFRHALVRGAMGVVELLITFGSVACIASLVSSRGRRLGDVFAGTLVVRERVPGARVMPVPPPPPWLAGRFTGLDLSAVPDGLWLTIRQYLTRMNQLDPHTGAAMAAKLADEVVARTGTPPPAGVPAAAFLAAVVHERQSREAARAFRAAPPHAPYGAQAAPAPVPYGAMPAVPAPVVTAPVAPPVRPEAVAPARVSPVEPPRGRTGFAPPA
ncbi:RDD family protein [Streptomyces sp. H27-G5]|uniref:RDD family protein n=1 Tax=Streptomyces sp. H27-G5 TaxID=2996698 RepID=UPI00226D8631|nr:RDD family protein [Streptomyces sp. H27-G5]MCY0918036.1 RDD family protein [Streptomyces sp. H27-G5]